MRKSTKDQTLANITQSLTPASPRTNHKHLNQTAGLEPQDRYMSQRTRRENVHVELIMNTSLDAERSNARQSLSPSKEAIPLEDDRNSVNLLHQKKKMRQMKQEIQNVLDASASMGNYDAFQIDDEIIDKKICKISFNENDNMVKNGRITIQNRIKPFKIDIQKFNLAFQSFKILVSQTDSTLKQPTKVQEYRLIGNKVQIPVHVDGHGLRQFVYFKIIQFEDLMIDEEEEERVQDRYLKVTVHFGFNNYNKLIQNQKQNMQKGDVNKQ